MHHRPPGHIPHKTSALCGKAGQGAFYRRGKKTYEREPRVFLEKRRYFYVKTILKSLQWPSDRELCAVSCFKRFRGAVRGGWEGTRGGQSRGRCPVPGLCLGGRRSTVKEVHRDLGDLRSESPTKRHRSQYTRGSAPCRLALGRWEGGWHGCPQGAGSGCSEVPGREALRGSTGGRSPSCTWLCAGRWLSGCAGPRWFAGSSGWGHRIGAQRGWGRRQDTGGRSWKPTLRAGVQVPETWKAGSVGPPCAVIKGLPVDPPAPAREDPKMPVPSWMLALGRGLVGARGLWSPFWSPACRSSLPGEVWTLGAQCVGVLRSAI
ncbi:uncharacterized protein LOC123651814 [Pipistrellus kuhlii]|uniref:uncharacterized protein LOC123651814 n=1 Tax=Pipistrellus kuhlii TaxID=59472 RepID=UPI001E270BAF|nr:uncharacterized protein LOC123651814 [Pipistrellus kuhlii]